MLQLNHISIKGNNGDILNDCTYRFNEGEVYVLYINDEDGRILFDCLSKYRKPNEGEITTWTDAVIYNMFSDDILPLELTVGEFLYSLSRINNVEKNLEVALLNVPYLKDKMDVRIKSLSKEDILLLKAVVFMTLKPYINLWYGEFPSDDIMKKFIDIIGEFNVYIFAANDISECNRLTNLLSAKYIEFIGGKVVEHI